MSRPAVSSRFNGNQPDRRTNRPGQTEADGTFHIPLAPGEYILHPESPNVMPFAPDQSFTVPEAEFIYMVVNYDSGIR